MKSNLKIFLPNSIFRAVCSEKLMQTIFFKNKGNLHNPILHGLFTRWKLNVNRLRASYEAL